MIQEGSNVQQKKSKKKKSRVGLGILKFFVLLLVTIAVLSGVVLGVVYEIYHGPSDSMKKLVVRSLNETSAAGFVNRIFLSEEEVNEIVNRPQEEAEEIKETDTSLITIKTAETEENGSEETVKNDDGTDAWGLKDEDGDGIIMCDIKGEGFSGFMAVILDPSRVIMGSVPESFSRRGYTVAEMCEYYDAIVGINAGGFYDPNGSGNGSIPDSLVVFDGKTYYADWGTRDGFVGLDYDCILHVSGKTTQQEIEAANIRYGVCFGPVLISNGEPVDPESLSSGVNPRTAIGQRSDGAILMLVIDGRSALSIGAKFQDVQDIMLQYGAVNACNLDGGSSTMMWYDGGYINNCASVIGIRPVPTTFLVLKEGKTIDDFK